MKIKHVLAGFGLTLAASFGLVAGLSSRSVAAERADATVTQDSVYYFAGSTTSWDENKIQLYTNSENDNKGELLNFEIHQNDQFKFKFADTWDGSLGYYQIDGGSAKSAFGIANGNIGALVDGVFNFYITNNDRIYVEFATGTNVYVQVKDWENTYVYAFDESAKESSGATIEPLGAWPGTKVSDVTEGVNFAADYWIGGGIARVYVPYVSLASTKIIINNNDSAQSGDCDLLAGAFYYNTGLIGDTDKGTYAKAVFEIAAVVNAADSSCDVAKADAEKVLGDNSSVLTAAQVTSSTLWTWKTTAKEEKDNFTFDKIIARLQLIAAGEESSGNSHGIESNNTLIIVISIVSAISLVGLSTLLVLKKKHK